MSNFILIPKAIQQINKKCKLKEIYAYGLIRSQITDGSYTASLSQEDLAKMAGWSKSSVVNYIKDLVALGLITEGDSRKCKDGDHRYNVYQFPKLESDYSIYDPAFFSDPTLSSEQKGLIMLLKTHCFPGSNHLPYPSNIKASELVGIGYESLTKKVDQLIAMGQAKRVGDTLILLNSNLRHALDMRISTNWAYSVIYNYCVRKDVVPPTKSKTAKMDLGLIAAKYQDHESLSQALETRFQMLPPRVNISYFAQGLVGKHTIKAIQNRTHPLYPTEPKTIIL